MHTVSGDIVSFFKNIWAEIIGFFSGLFHHGTKA